VLIATNLVNGHYGYKLQQMVQNSATLYLSESTPINRKWKKSCYFPGMELNMQVKFYRHSFDMITHLIIPKTQLFWKKSGDDVEVVQCPFKGVYSDHFLTPKSNKLRFWYHMKAHIFLITPVKFHSQIMFRLADMVKIVVNYWKFTLLK